MSQVLGKSALEMSADSRTPMTVSYAFSSQQPFHSPGSYRRPEDRTSMDRLSDFRERDFTGRRVSA
jgi:hypothetical protein